MLVLTRKLGEVIRVGDTVTVRVLEVKGNHVRLGVDAPSDVRIYREEVYRAICRESGQAVPEDADAAGAGAAAWRGQHHKS